MHFDWTISIGSLGVAAINLIVAPLVWAVRGYVRTLSETVTAVHRDLGQIGRTVAILETRQGTHETEDERRFTELREDIRTSWPRNGGHA